MRMITVTAALSAATFGLLPMNLLGEASDSHTTAAVSPAAVAAAPAAARAKSDGKVQTLDVTVSGKYDPAEIEVQKDIPVVLKMHRKDSSKCSESFEIPELGVKEKLAGKATTEVKFTPTKEGAFTFQCGMGMMHGKLIVKAGAGESAGK